MRPVTRMAVHAASCSNVSTAPGEFQPGHQRAGDRGPAAQGAMRAASGAGRKSLSGLASGSTVEQALDAGDRVGDLPEPGRPRANSSAAWAAGTRSATRQPRSSVGDVAGTAGRRRRGHAPGEHRVSELRPPLQPAGGFAHPGALEQLPTQRLGLRRGGTRLRRVGRQQQSRP